MAAVKIVTGRRGVMGTFALTMASNAIGLESKGIKPAVAAGSTLMPAELTNHLVDGVVLIPCAGGKLLEL
jgi:hypothetical protein